MSPVPDGWSRPPRQVVHGPPGLPLESQLVWDRLIHEKFITAQNTSITEFIHWNISYKRPFHSSLNSLRELSWFTYIFRFRFSELRQILFLRQSINIWTLYAFVSYYILFIWYTKARHQLKFLCQNDKDLLTSAPILSIYSTAGVFSFCQLFIYIAKEVCMISCYTLGDMQVIV